MFDPLTPLLFCRSLKILHCPLVDYFVKYILLIQQLRNVIVAWQNRAPVLVEICWVVLLWWDVEIRACCSTWHEKKHEFMKTLCLWRKFHLVFKRSVHWRHLYLGWGSERDSEEIHCRFSVRPTVAREAGSEDGMKICVTKYLHRNTSVLLHIVTCGDVDFSSFFLLLFHYYVVPTVTPGHSWLGSYLGKKISCITSEGREHHWLTVTGSSSRSWSSTALLLFFFFFFTARLCCNPKIELWQTQSDVSQWDADRMWSHGSSSAPVLHLDSDESVRWEKEEVCFP